MMGPNGSGKTTAAELICGMLEPSRGEVEVCGYSIHQEPAAIMARKNLAYVPDSPRLYDDLTVANHLQLVAAAHGVANHRLSERSEDLLTRLNLASRASFFPRQLSRGMRQKTAIACALIRPFRVLVLDEPTVGLDPESLDVLRQVLVECRQAGRAALVTTHSDSFAASVVTRVVHISEGRLVG